MHLIKPPQTESELLARCRTLEGLSFAELANTLSYTLPQSLARTKGFMGQLIEQALGASAGNLPEADFPKLGIELKTIPLNKNGQARESTYVCTAPIHFARALETWEHSRLRKKLARVLWVPLEADPSIPMDQRRIGNAILWSPDPLTESILRQDWEELSFMLHLGQIQNLSAKIGMYLQIRPKAAHSRILSPSINEQGEATWINPRGFYLRAAFTQTILEQHYCL